MGAGYSQREIDDFYSALEDAGLGRAGIGGGFGLNQSTKFTIGSMGGLMGVIGALIGSEVTAATQEQSKKNWTPKLPAIPAIQENTKSIPIENYLSQELPLNVVRPNAGHINPSLEKFEQLQMEKAMQQAQTTNAFNRGFGEYVAPKEDPSIDYPRELPESPPIDIPRNNPKSPPIDIPRAVPNNLNPNISDVIGNIR